MESSIQDIATLRKSLADSGTSLVVAGDQSLAKVHLHTTEPASVRKLLEDFGNVISEKIEDMGAQHRDFSGQVGAGPPGQTAVVAVANGKGLVQVLKGLGATTIVEGGQTMNPSTQEILEAIEVSGSEEVIVLPNNGNIVPAARQAANLASNTRVHVIPTTDIIHGIGAMMSFNFEATGEQNSKAMVRSMQQISSGEVTTAMRDSVVEGKSVAKGQSIAFAGGSLVASGTLNQALSSLVSFLVHAEEADVTLYYGSEVTLTQAEAAVDMLVDLHPTAEIQAVAGGQPHYHYLISVE